MLQIVDAQWKDHLYSLDHLKEGIGLRGYGQRDPLVEYKKESFALFTAMKDRIEEEIVRYLWRLTPVMGDDPAAAPVRQPPPRRPPPMTMQRAAGAAAIAVRRHRRRGGADEALPEPPRPARTGGDDTITPGQARRAQGRPQRPLSVRQRQEVQEVPWRMTTPARRSDVTRQGQDGNELKAATRLLPFVF